jgi:hypothetical protein
LRAQRLDSVRPPADVHGVVRDVFALQAQDEAAANLGIWTRGDSLTSAEVTRAREQDRSIVRLWCLRGTLHLVAAEDVRWLLDLLRPLFVNANRTRRAELGLDDETTARGVRAVVQLLGAAGCLTRAEIAERLAGLGIPSAGQATIHIIWRAALDGRVCYGPARKGEAAFVLLDDWVAPAGRHEREEGLAELARRYLHAYGPATPEDLAAWSGLSLADARRGWRQLGDGLVSIPSVAGPMWLPACAEAPHDAASSAVRLLPAFDGLWLGYRERDLLLPGSSRGRVYPGGGVIRPAILIDGEPVGTWTRRKRGQAVDVALDPFENHSAAHVREQLRPVATDLGRFLGQPVNLV